MAKGKFQLNKILGIDFIFSSHFQFSFVNSSSLRVHVRGVHMHVNRHICDICAKIYNSKTCYDQHKLTEHSDIKWSKVQCTICQNW